MATAGLEVVYCPHCGMAPELCSYGPAALYAASCKPWIAANFPSLLPSTAAAAPAAAGDAAAGDAAAAALSGLSLSGGSGEAAAAGAAAPAAAPAAPAAGGGGDGGGGGGAAKPAKGKGKSKSATAETISRKDRGRGKCVTILRGLESFDVKLKDAASALGKRYGTGASVTKDAAGVQEVTIQGDFCDELAEVLEDIWKIPEEAVVVTG